MGAAATQRVYGLETEYALVYHPTVFDTRPLDARGIYDVIEGLLVERHPTMPADGQKRGIFLDNGTLISFEAQTLRHGLLEVSTPECSNARQAVVWQSAHDDLLVDLLPEVHARLRAAGCHGQVVIGKNSTDHHGNHYGTHENYSIHLPCPHPRVPIACGLVAFEIAALLLEIPLYAIFAVLVVIGLPFRLRDLRDGGVIEPVIRAWSAMRKRYGRPFSRLHSRFLEATLLAPLTDSLPAYLVTRPIWCGSGTTETVMQRGAQAFEMAPALGLRCLFDLKPGGDGAWWGLQPRKRLHVTYSDSNLAETSILLKLGVTGRLLDMIEAGERFDDLRLARPLEALEIVARDTSLRQPLTLADGRRLTALEIQRAYWRRARAFHPEDDVVARWGGVLDALEQDPATLADRVDWIAKRALLAPLSGLPSATSESPVDPSPIVAALRREGVPASADDATVRAALARALPRARFATVQRAVEYHELGWTELSRRCHLAMQMRKIDLKYHELSEGGYARRLQAQGHLRVEVGEDEKARARSDPPGDSRAAIRARFIRAPHSPRARMEWGAFRDPADGRRERFHEPIVDT